MTTKTDSAIDQEKETMLGIADALNTAKSAATGIVRAITAVELYEATGDDEKKVAKLRGALVDARRRFNVAIETAGNVCDIEVEQQLSSYGKLFDKKAS